MRTNPPTMPVVYVAGPFRGNDAWEIEQNIRRAETLALEVWRAGAAGVCPHTNTRFYQGACPDHVWLAGDLEILRRCDAILMTPDWQKSEGARREHVEAFNRNLRIFYTVPELKAWVETWMAV